MISLNCQLAKDYDNSESIATLSMIFFNTGVPIGPVTIPVDPSLFREFNENIVKENYQHILPL